jgi:hypothetical protein
LASNGPWQRRRAGDGASVSPALVARHEPERVQEETDDTAHFDPSTTVGAAVQRTKGDRRALKHADLPLLQGAVGNRAMAGLLAVQRHSVRDAPPKPVPEELDDDSAVQSLAESVTVPVQRWDKGTLTKGVAKGSGPLLGQNRPKAPTPWARATGPAVGPRPQPRMGKRIPVLGSVAFTKPQLDADGASTGKALILRAPSRKMNWSFVGDSFGATIAPDGTITAGNDLKGAESRKVDVKAEDVLSPGATATGTFELYQPGILDARKDLTKFLAKSYTHKNFLSANGFGKYDATYDPTARLLTIGMRIKFSFPDDSGPLLSKTKRAERKARHKAYRDDFIDQVTKAWSGKFQFENVREPKSVWSRLNPVNVAVVVTPTDGKDAHFLLKAKMKTEGTANVSPNQVTTMYKGTDKAKEVFTDANKLGEASRLKQAAPDVFFKGNKSTELTDASVQAIDFLALYLRRLGKPKYNIETVGHAKNAKRANERASTLSTALTSAGVGPTHTVTPRGQVEAVSSTKGSFNPQIDPGYVNQQDVTAHEFGHMLGLDDEYEVRGNGGKGIETYDRVKDALGQKWADLTARAGIDSESVMDGGSDVRIQHYITMWDTLGKLTQTKADAPAAKFGDADWKFIG